MRPPSTKLSLIALSRARPIRIEAEEFNLVIFVATGERRVARAYFENIANYVEQGGALLDSAGPAFASPYSLYHSPLGDVLPPTHRQGAGTAFLPELTLMGRRPSVTSGLEGPGPAIRQPGDAGFARSVRRPAEREIQPS